MKIAFVDLHFCWPPVGGAQTDLYHVIQGVHQAGFDTHLFAARYDFLWRFGWFNPEELPFPSTPIDISWATYYPKFLTNQFREAVDKWNPDVVFVGFGRLMKPYLLEALHHYPLISRYYMYEHLCIRDFCLFYDGKTCPNDIFHTADVCRLCAWGTWKKETLHSKLTTYSDEYHRAKAYTPKFKDLFIRSLRKVRTVIVNNQLAKSRIVNICSDVRIIPGGVCLSAQSENIKKEPSFSKGKKVILFPGRADDSRKGLHVVLQVGEALANLRQDFEIWVTYPGILQRKQWLKNIGFIPQQDMQKIYAQADICVVPSVWEEPFGLVAVEAMAAGLPVCASKCGGLQEIVQHGVTGFLFTPGEPIELGLYLNKLLDDDSLRIQMGTAGRARVLEEFTWDRIILKYYLPLFQEVNQ